METRVVAKVVVVNNDNKILLLRRSKTDIRRPLQWDIPGGHTDGDEYANEAASRETAEEAGIQVDARKLQLVYSVCQAVDPTLNVVWLFFVGHTNADEVRISQEHEDYKWVTLAEAIKLIDYDRQKVAFEYMQANNLLV